MKLLVTDLDNTLYDWVTFFATAYHAMAAELARILDIDVRQVNSEFSEINRQYGTLEHPYAALQLKSVKHRFSGCTTAEVGRALDEAFHAFNKSREESLLTYPGVEGTLDILSANGVTVVGHTEAPVINALYRLNKLGIAQYFTHLYTRKSAPVNRPWPEKSLEFVGRQPTVVTVPDSERKPNPRLLLDIASKENAIPSDSYYLGDSLHKDIAMAKEAGFVAIWAKYGTKYSQEKWKILLDITPWTSEEVTASQIKIIEKRARPDFTIDCITEVIDIILSGANPSQ